MPGAAVDVGTGTTIVFGTSGWAGNIESINWTGITRAAIPTSHMGTAAPGANKMANMTFLGGDLVDPGQLAITAQFNPQTNPPMHGALETVTITWPLVTGDSTPANWSASGIMTSFDITDPLDDKMMCNITVKLSGNITFVDAA